MKTYYLVGRAGTLVKPVRVRADGLVPDRYLAPDITCVPHTALGSVVGGPGPNWSSHDPVNSIVAAMLYEPVRHNVRWEILKHLLRLRHVGPGWVSGADLITKYGTEALRRRRELVNDYNWPMQEEPPASGTGVWDYRLLVDRGLVRQAFAQLP